MIEPYNKLYEDVYDEHKRIYDEYKEYQRQQAAIRKQEERERRTRFWLGLTQTVLQGVSDGLNIYMQSQYGAFNSTPMRIPSSNSPTPVADFVSQPNFFQNQMNMLLQQSFNQTQMQAYNEYTMVRQNWQRAGTDLSFDEFMRMKGEAYANTHGMSGTSIDTGNTTTPKKNKPQGKRKCSFCGGTGRRVVSNSVAMLGTADYKYRCKECGREYLKSSGHAHIFCGECGGTGYW